MVWLSPHRPPLQGTTMANLKITVNGFNDVYRDIVTFGNNLKFNAQKASNKLGNIARDEAQARYGAWDVTVDNIPKARGIGNTVKATGNKDLKSHDGEVIGSTILIAEYGAGDLADSHPWASEMPLAYPGSYSETYGTHEYADSYPRRWHWQGMTFAYQVPTYAMYYGSQKAENSALSVFREVFK